MDVVGLIRRRRWFLLFIGVPVFLTAIYYGFIASDIYISESRFVIKSPTQRPSQVSTLANLIQTTGLSSGQEQANEIMDYIRSRDAMTALSRGKSVENLFAHPGVDPFSRYPGIFRQKHQENLYHYYRKMIDVSLDHDTGLVVLRTRAFNSSDAHALNEMLLTLSENLVNELNERGRTRGVSEAENVVAKAEKRVRAARLALARFRRSVQLIDPARQASGVLEIANKLVAEKAALQAQLGLMTGMTPDNPSIPSIRAQIAGLDRQILSLNGQVVGASGAIADKLAPYESLVLEQEFGSQMLTAANASLEQARMDTLKQQYYVERVVQPSLPDRPAEPFRLRMILTVLGICVSLYFIGWMFIVGVLEHAPGN